MPPLRRPVALTLLSLLALAALDLWAGTRATRRVQHVRATAETVFGERDGVPYWITDDAEHHARDCRAAPGGLTVAALGSSILHGSGLRSADTFAPALRDLLPGPPGCVHNLAEPASAWETQLALARDRQPELQPDVVLWELWGNSPNHFTRVGGEAWNFGPLAPPEGGPPAPLDLPRSLTRALFSVSGLWRLWSVQGEPPPPPGGDPLAPWHDLVDEEPGAGPGARARARCAPRPGRGEPPGPTLRRDGGEPASGSRPRA